MTIKPVTDLVGDARAEIENLDAGRFEAQAGAEGALVVDLREAVERAESGAIPGAVHAPRGLLEFYADPAFPKHKPEFQADRRILLYCASGGRSALAARTLQQMGYSNIAHLDGGFAAWTGAGKPVESIGGRA